MHEKFFGGECEGNRFCKKWFLSQKYVITFRWISDAREDFKPREEKTFLKNCFLPSSSLPAAPGQKTFHEF